MSIAALGSRQAQLSQIQLASTFVGTTAYALLPSVLDGQMAGASVTPSTSPPLPRVRVQIAFEADPTELEPTWTDVTVDVLRGSIRRGRSHELDRFEAGTCVLELIDRHRDYDPSYAGSPHYPYVKPMRRVRVQAEVDGIWYALFSGFTEKITPSWKVLTGYVTISCADAFKVLARKEINASWSSERSDLRIDRVLDLVGWTREWWSLGHPVLSVLGSTTKVAGAGDDTRVLMQGQTTIQATTLENEAALAHMQAVTLAENGRLWIRGDGTVVFLDRASSDQPVEYRAVFGDRAGEIPYRDLSPDYGDDTIYNEIRVERSGGTVQTASDTDSQDEYLARTLSRTGMLMSSDPEALASAQWLLGRYKQPFLRFTAMTLDGQARWGVWRHVLGNDIGHQILVRRRPDGVTTPIEQQSVIEGVAHDFDDASWSTSWQLSPAFVQQRWLLGDATYSVLGTSTIVTY